MNAQSAELDWMLPDDLAAPTRSPAFETALAAWPLVAALAWQGYCDRGRGTVMLDEEGQLAYHPGSPCECHQADVELYDPKRQAVVALHKGTRIDSVLVVAGWPAPPDAYRITPAEPRPPNGSDSRRTERLRFEAPFAAALLSRR